MSLLPELLLLGHTAALGGAAVFGFSNVVYKSQSNEIHPVFINVLKMWIALPLMVVLVLLPWRPGGFIVPVTAILPLTLSVLSGPVIGDLLYLLGQARIGVSRAFPIAMTFPLITYFFSIVILNEPLLITRIIGVILAIIGISVISHERTNQTTRVLDPTEPATPWFILKLGVILPFAAAFLWASSSLFLQVALSEVDPIDGNLIRVIVGSGALLIIFFIGRRRGIALPTRRATKFTLIAGFFGMGVGSILYVSAVKITGAAVTSALASTAPLFAMPFSIYFLKEKVTVAIALGTLATVVGIWLVILGI